MKIRIFKDEEIERLEENKFVIKVQYSRAIIYDPAFKLWCIMMRLYHPELSAKEIFKAGDFDVDMLSTRTPQERIREWMINYKKYGVDYFVPENKEYYLLPTTNKKHKNNNYDRKQFIESTIRLLNQYDKNR